MIKDLYLSKGTHETPESGRCFMEMVAYIAGEAHSDHPACACPVLTRYGIALNDITDDELRQELLPMVIMVAGSKSTRGIELKRMDFIVRQTFLRILCPLLESRNYRNVDKVRQAAISGTYHDMKPADAAYAAAAAAADDDDDDAAAAAAYAAAAAAAAAAAYADDDAAAAAAAAYAAYAAADATAADGSYLQEAFQILREAIDIGYAECSIETRKRAEAVGLPV